jgi:hypothetical protein
MDLLYIHASGVTALFNFSAHGVNGIAKGELDESKIREPESFCPSAD